MARSVGVMGGAIAVLLLVGCGDGEGPADGTSSSTSASTTSASSTSSGRSAAKPTADQSTATGAVVAFRKMRDDLAGSPTKPLTDLSQVARGEARKDEMKTLQIYRTKGWRSSGATGLDDLRQTSSTKDGAKVSACVDYSQVDVVDADGASVVSDDRQERVLHRYTVAHDDTADTWFVAEVETKGASC